MPCSISLLVLLAIALAVTAERARAQTPSRAVIEGTVVDTVSGRPIALAVVRVAETGVSVLTSDAGRYRLTAPAGTVRLEVRRIGYTPVSVDVAADEGTTRRDVYLHAAAFMLAPVTATAIDDEARRIIRRAIARKHELFGAMHDYRYQASVKFVVRDLGKPQEAPASVVLLTETRTSAYWEQPDRYQETIVARRQSNNIGAEQNMVSVGEIVNFNRDRIDLEKYAVVSPVADDALEHYGYRMLDTLAVEGRRIFRLAIEPESQASPLFDGVIDIADSTYDVVAVDVGVNRAVRFDMLSNLRYRQRLRDMGGGRWMPSEIRLTGDVHLGIPFPGIPRNMAFEQLALLDGFRFDEGKRPSDLGEVRIVVADGADRADSGTWTGPNAIPLSDVERAAWQRIDSLARRPAGFGGAVRTGLGVALLLATNEDFFHFNRVDGAYVGAGWTWRQLPELTLRTKLGYATGSDRWQYEFGGLVRLSRAARFWVGGAYHDETMRRPTLVSSELNPTLPALFARLDPLDYYRERGLTVTALAKLVNFTRLELQYSDQRQSSLPVVTDYAVFSVDRAQRANVPIVDGTLRSLAANLTYDSRPLIGRRGREERLGSLTWTRFTVGAEVASPSLFANDFDFRRYAFRLERRQRTLNLGLTTVTAAGGIATGRVPPQRYFTVDYGLQGTAYQGTGFNTLDEVNYSGTRALMVTAHHDFDRLLFAKSGIPLVRQLPFTLSVHGGAFWTDFRNHTPNPADALLTTAPSAYTELGFGVGNLTPFLSPINLAAYFTWQLSSYPTRRFQFGLGLTPP